MAQSPAHRFGQIIGELLEEILDERLTRFCASRPGYHLDRKGVRPGVRTGKKLTWADKYENAHDLDFVIERGTAATQGRPVAFIESAWRRYTKHSKNKAQEIQGAILPIRERYHRDAPFIGVVLAGKFTKPALKQLEAQGFKVVYLSYDAIMQGLGAVGIEARFDEDTPDPAFKTCVTELDSLRRDHRKASKLRDAIVEACGGAFDAFFAALSCTLDRRVEEVEIVPLYGKPIATAMMDVEQLKDFRVPTSAALPLRRFDVSVRFSNGDTVVERLSDAAEVRAFLDDVPR